MDAWADLDIPDFLRLSADERRAAWKRNPPKSLRDHKGQKTPFHLPKTIEPEGLKLLKAAEREAERKKAERLEVLKALPKKPPSARKARSSIKRKPSHVKPRKPQSRSGAAKQPSARTRKPARARQRD